MRYRRLGKTGFNASILGLGGESALYRRSDKAIAIILRALELGINYFDTAPLYEESELNYGEILPRHRADMFIATKTDQRSYGDAWRQFERSLKRLRVDRVDLLQIHHLDYPHELDEIFDPQGAVRMVHEAKEQGLARFVGVTGHTDPDVLLESIERYPFDTILMALNPAEVHVHSFQAELLPRAVRMDMGVIAMKVFSRGIFFERLPWAADLLLDYALTLPIASAIVGVMNESQLIRNAEIASRWSAMPQGDMEELEEESLPFAAEINFYRKGARGPFPTPETMIARVH